MYSPVIFSRCCLKPIHLILALGLTLSPVVKSGTDITASPIPISSSFTALNQLTQSDYQWIGRKIYQNECAGKPKYLTYWGKGETFPSFGIGHFIWHPKISENSAGKSAEVTFTETFPAMVQFVSQTLRPPVWLDDLSKQTAFSAPWSSKASFDQAWSNDALQQLRDWLLATQAPQAKFIVLAFKKRWLNETQSLPLAQQDILQLRLNRMMGFKKGLFAVLDYFNFKGIGVNQREQYQTESWGLASVLRTMAVTEYSTNDEYLYEFVMAAKQRLRLRVRLAPPERNEVRWLKGWEVRLDQYLN